jgi:hypothetical protein
MNGALSGLVAITSGCGVVEPWAAIVIGLVAGWIYLYTSNLLLRVRIDDAVDAIPVHMFNGMFGVFATGLFASPRLMETAYGTSEYPGLFYGLASGTNPGNLIACQVITILFVFGWTSATMFPFFIWLNYKGWFRADSLEELVGLDISYHGTYLPLVFLSTPLCLATHLFLFLIALSHFDPILGGMDNKDGSVKKEYVEAYKRHKGSLRNRRNTNQTVSDGGWNDSGGNDGDGDPLTDQEAAAEEAQRAGE